MLLCSPAEPVQSPAALGALSEQEGAQWISGAESSQSSQAAPLSLGYTNTSPTPRQHRHSSPQSRDRAQPKAPGARVFGKVQVSCQVSNAGGREARVGNSILEALGWSNPEAGIKAECVCLCTQNTEMSLEFFLHHFPSISDPEQRTHHSVPAITFSNLLFHCVASICKPWRTSNN